MKKLPNFYSTGRRKSKTRLNLLDPGDVMKKSQFINILVKFFDLVGVPRKKTEKNLEVVKFK